MSGRLKGNVQYVFEFSEKTTRLMYEWIHQTGFRQANKIQFPDSKADFCANPNKCSRRDIFQPTTKNEQPTTIL